MKKIVFMAALLLSVSALVAQNPVSWAYSSKKLGDKVYEVRMTATIQPGWHLYAQQQPNDAIAQPTAINFAKNPLLNFDGKVKEVGKLEKYKDEKLDISANQYSGKVDFVQIVKTKGNVKTNVAGKLVYQTCDDKKCLPPKTVDFTISLK